MKVWQEVAQRLVGTTQRVLLEDAASAENGEMMKARAANYFTVYLEGAESDSNGWQNVEITGFGKDSLIARRST